VKSMPSLAIDARPAGFGALRSALAAMRLGAGGAMAGWPVLLGRSGFYVLLMIVLTALWDKVVAERVSGALVAALPAGGLALYVGVTEWIGLSVPAIHLRLEDDIRSGAVETHLLRPKAYLVQRFAESWGAMLVRMAATGAAALVMLALSGRGWPAPAALAALVVLGPLGGTIGLLLFTIAGLSAFWVRRTVPAFLILQKMLFLLGGLFAPVTLYPTWLTRLAEATPFAAHMFWPASLTITPTAAQMTEVLAAQLLWIGLLASLAGLIWRAGLAKVLRGDL
jgi:ABC-2 type transport system permease protein